MTLREVLKREADRKQDTAVECAADKRYQLATRRQDEAMQILDTIIALTSLTPNLLDCPIPTLNKWLRERL